MNWYAILLFLIASPIGWAMIAGLTLMFIYTSWRFEKAMKLSSGPAPTTEGSKESRPWATNPKVWFSAQLIVGLILILLLGLPMACTFTRV